MQDLHEVDAIYRYVQAMSQLSGGIYFANLEKKR